MIKEIYAFGDSSLCLSKDNILYVFDQRNNGVLGDGIHGRDFLYGTARGPAKVTIFKGLNMAKMECVRDHCC